MTLYLLQDYHITKWKAHPDILLNEPNLSKNRDDIHSQHAEAIEKPAQHQENAFLIHRGGGEGGGEVNDGRGEIL